MSLNPKLVVPIGLGLSLFTVTAFVIYYIFKKDEHEVDGNKKSIKTSRVNVIELKVAKSIVPALIGRSASNIKEMERKSGAQIHLKKLSEGDHDICIIRGRSDATQIAETLVHEFIKNQPVIVDDVMMVPNWACGRIIGTGGEIINEMSHRSGARIKLEGEKTSEMNASRHVNLKGTKEQIEKAKQLIEACISQEKCRREIDQSKRNPRHVQSASSASPTPANSESGDLTGDTHTPKHAANHKSEATGAAIEVYVSAVSSPSRFWVQFVGPQVSNLDQLVDTMTEYYNNKDNREAHTLQSVSVGQLVAAVFRHDGRWYRARVVDIKPNEFDTTQKVADVFFVDYGDSEYVATHELCELRADYLRLRFQAMECYLSGVRPSGAHDVSEAHKWHPHAVERFEELTQVARWKPLVSKTCSYKKTMTAEGEKEKEIPGIKLFDVTEEGEIDIGAALIEENWAEICISPRPSPARTTSKQPVFGDLTHSSVLGMELDHAGRSTSLPKDHERTENGVNGTSAAAAAAEVAMPSSMSLGTGMDNPKMPSDLLAMAYGQTKKTASNTQNDFLHSERQHDESSKEALNSPVNKNLMKANMNRIDSHHGSLQSLGKERL